MIEPGKYVIAVSGGVDSTVLLDLLATSHLPSPTSQFIVAHFDHGIRPDSSKDRVFVQNLANKYGLEFVYRRQELGSGASEDQARRARYQFLNQVKEMHDARAIITAHHADDVLETAIFNILRGTNRRGLSSLKSGIIVRPLLDYKKAQIIDYAQKNKLSWVEDSTNHQLKYSRNKIRKFLGSLPDDRLDQLTGLISQASVINQQADDIVHELFSNYYQPETKSLSRQLFVSLPHKIAAEMVVYWLIMIGADYDKKLVNKLVNDIKTLKPGAKLDINKDYYFLLSAKQISLKNRTSV